MNKTGKKKLQSIYKDWDETGWRQKSQLEHPQPERNRKKINKNKEFISKVHKILCQNMWRYTHPYYKKSFGWIVDERDRKKINCYPES